MPAQHQERLPKRPGEAQKAIAKGDKEGAQEKGQLLHLYQQGAQAGPPHHWVTGISFLMDMTFEGM